MTNEKHNFHLTDSEVPVEHEWWCGSLMGKNKYRHEISVFCGREELLLILQILIVLIKCVI